MKNLFDENAVKEIYERIEGLTPSSQRQWGSMNVAQMVAHCTSALKLPLGEERLPRSFLGRVVGPFVKSIFYNDQPLEKNMPSSDEYIIINSRKLEEEKIILLAKITQFFEGGKEECTKAPHPFFGYFTPEQWGMGMYKHLDHHLKQFGA